MLSYILVCFLYNIYQNHMKHKQKVNLKSFLVLFSTGKLKSKFKIIFAMNF